MEDSTLLKYALIGSLCGLFVLWFATANASGTEVRLEDIDENLLGKYVKVFGTAEKIKYYNKSTAFLLKDGNEELKVYARFLWKNLSKGTNLTVSGVLQEYRGEIELVVDEQWN